MLAIPIQDNDTNPWVIHAAKVCFYFTKKGGMFFKVASTCNRTNHNAFFAVNFRIKPQTTIAITAANKLHFSEVSEDATLTCQSATSG